MTERWKNEFYSQFGEDGILFAYFRSKEYGRTRELHNIPVGYYVDIGAHHPWIISNTWFFYQMGWHGICVDPTPGTIAKFQEIRPRDLTLEVAISDRDGETAFFVDGASVSNSLARDYASAAAIEITVPTLRLSTLFDRHLPAETEINILSVDAESLDATVLNSNDWRRYRPEIVLAEQHGNSIRTLIGSDLVLAMETRGYDLFAWTQPSLIFRRR